MSTTKQRRDLYQEVTDKIIAAIESGTAPWQRGWAELAELGLPMNGQSARQYNGINSFLLFLTSQERGYSDNRFFTFKQVNELGAKVRKGEKSTPVYFFKMLQATERDGVAAKSTGDTPRMIPFLTEYRVFNAQQVEGIEPRNVPERQWTPIQAVEQLVERMQPRIEHGGKAYKWVSPGHVGVADRIVMLPGGVVWFVELKSSTGRLSPLQKIFAVDMVRMGMNYMVIRSKEEVDQWFLDLTKS